MFDDYSAVRTAELMNLYKITPDQLWLLCLTAWLAGPWIVRFGVAQRFDLHGKPLCVAYSQAELEKEDIRLKKLGYLLTDENRIIPNDWWVK